MVTTGSCFLTKARAAFHPRHPLSADVGGEHGPKSVLTRAHGLVANVDPVFEEEILDVPQRPGAPHIHHHDKADYLRR